MTYLSDLVVGDAIVVLGRVTAQDAVTGDTLSMLGPDGAVQGTIIISPAGVFSGQLAAAASATTVQLVPGMTAVSVGDVMYQASTGETHVVRQVQVQTDGSYKWSNSTAAGSPWNDTVSWVKTGTATIT